MRLLELKSTNQNNTQKKKKYEITMVLGNFNMKVGTVSKNDLVGHVGLDRRYDRGDQVNPFQREVLIFVNKTFYKLPNKT